MIIVRPIQDKALQREYSEKCGIDYCERCFAYSIYDGDRFIGMCDFTIGAEGGVIRKLVNIPGVSDAQALEMAGRAVLSFMDNCGVKTAYFTPENDVMSSLARRMLFKPAEGGVYAVALEHYFDHPCNG